MNMTEIRSIALDKGIKTGKRSKIDLIHTIQRTEGNFDCFATAANGECDQMGCQWREDCLGRTQH
ncbi:MAG: SAP domain-containing protein [Gammaproteobacteria bacterium]|nr:SAP domain-containing protein [Gammaproteobacteria bacterium]